MSPEETSVYPLERINLQFKSAAQGEEDIELPFRLMMVGDYSTGPNDTPLMERKPQAINKTNFGDVMKAKKLQLDLSVKNHLSDDPEAQLQAKLKVESLRDFTPDEIVEQLPELKSQWEVREALKNLKGDIANPDKRKKLLAAIKKALEGGEVSGGQGDQ